VIAPHRPLAVLAGALGLMALAADLPRPAGDAVDVAALARAVENEEDHVTALELAAWIRDGKPGLRVVDVRDAAAYAAYHVPTAEHRSLAELVAAEPAEGETLVLYSEGGTHAAQGWVLLRARGAERVHVLREGLYEWLTTVMEPTLPHGATPRQRAAFDSAAALARYFGGVPRVGGTSPDDAVQVDGASPDRSSPGPSVGGTATEGSTVDATATDAAVLRVRRRGC
jgi:rhodanese-related sulfurtransferase